jgi:hypothetical protein
MGAEITGHFIPSRSMSFVLIVIFDQLDHEHYRGFVGWEYKDLEKRKSTQNFDRFR